MSNEPAEQSRREKYAEQTRQDVISSARSLFSSAGFTATTVDAIARAAGVSPATVYAQCGGKEGLLGSLIDLWTAGDAVQQIVEHCAEEHDPRAMLDVLAAGYRRIYEESGDIIRIVTDAAPSATTARDFLDVANERHLDALRQIVGAIGTELIDGLTVDDAARIVFFHFRYEQFVLAAEWFGWGEEAAARWITERIAASILSPSTPGPRP